MTAKPPLILASVGALCVFVGIVAGGVAIGYLSAPLDERGEPSYDWMLASFVIATTLATTAVFAIGRATARAFERVAARRHEAIYAQQRAEHALRVETLQAELRAIPDLAHYAPIVDQAPWLANVDDARRREALVQRLRRDARTAPYAERAFHGEAISDALIAHWQEPERPLICVHFRSLEAPLRAQPGGLVPVTEQQLRVNANLDSAVAALRSGSDDNAIDYRVEELQPGRGSDFYQGGQTLRCRHCGCTIAGSAFGPNVFGA